MEPRNEEPDEAKVSRPVLKGGGIGRPVSPTQRENGPVALVPATAPATVDSLTTWSTRYQQLAVAGVRSEDVGKKIALQLGRFIAFYQDAYGYDRVSTCLKRDVVAWQQHLIAEGLAPATVNNHLAALSAFTSWVSTHAPRLFPFGDQSGSAPHASRRSCDPSRSTT